MANSTTGDHRRVSNGETEAGTATLASESAVDIEEVVSPAARPLWWGDTRNAVIGAQRPVRYPRLSGAT